ncbi:Nhl domain-containing protein [Thalictrum thalictroides]|uniref:Nhl domain-containing protein n=1 Tax=Thalictrum thalictroides TaxID=46969 RepID=A0A7J6X3J4_THATH|nr:Nhl domain-containing protein [Thalictrum thalictroides]
MSSILIFFVFLFLTIPTTTATKRHVITFRSPNLFPEGITYDPSSKHFLVGSLNHRIINSVNHDGIVKTLISDPNLPLNVTFLGLTVDSINRRLLAVIHAIPPLSPFNALASYDLSSFQRVFLTNLQSNDDDEIQIANDVTVDYSGNAYVTNSVGNFIWKVNTQGEASIFSISLAFTAYPIPRDLPSSLLPYESCGLNGIDYVKKGYGYLLVVQTNTGKLFKVDADDGKARLVLMNKDLTGADGIAVRSDGVVAVVSQYKLWLLKSQDNWGEAIIYDEIALNTEKFPTSVVTKEDEVKQYVLYGSVHEGILGKGEKELFGIEEIQSSHDSEDEMIWMFVIIGLGLAYFMYWRFQMGKLVNNMSKKVA